mmetsp:Transcript_57258/g.186143  ORF Transcript_57258/g.186143 Transcript_57258/m.186143 type:complete len:229 (+) Transcript_57258:506-1192(+)
MLHPPAAIIGLEHVDYPEKVHLLPVDGDVPTSGCQMSQPRLSLVRGRIRRNSVDAHEQRIVHQSLGGQKGRVGEDHLDQLRLVLRRDIAHHGDIHPFPISQRSPSGSASQVFAGVDVVQDSGVQGSPVGGGPLQIEGQPLAHRQEVAHDHKIDLAGPLPPQRHRVAAKILDQRSALPLPDVGVVGRQEGHQCPLLLDRDLFDDESGVHPSGRIIHHPVEERARCTLRH